MMSDSKCTGYKNGCECLGCRVFTLIEMDPDSDPSFVLERIVQIAAALVRNAPEEMQDILIDESLETFLDATHNRMPPKRQPYTERTMH